MTPQRLRANLDAIVWYAGRVPYKPLLELAGITVAIGVLKLALLHH